MEDNLLNIWEAYGFKENPFNTRPLSLYGENLLSIEKAFVGRKNTEESDLLLRLLDSPGGNRIVIEGEIGVGKTTFINYHRHFWEHKVKKEQKLFTSYGEIPIYYNWQPKDFLLNILSHLLHKMVLTFGLEKITSEPLFEELLILDKVYQQSSYQIEGQILGIGGGYGKSKNITIPNITEARLQFYLQETIKAILQKGYRGIILHFDNLEILQSGRLEECQQIFQNLRDTFQIPEVYFIFIGPTGFFRKVISPLERVRSIFFGWPIYVPPLTKEETLEAIHLRYELLAMKQLCWIKPVEDNCISFLYDLYEGKIRFIMDALQAILTRFPRSIGKILSLEDVQKLLFGFMEEKILKILTTREIEVLLQGASFGRFTNIQLTKYLDLKKSNVAKYLQKFQELGFVKLAKKEGRNIFYEVSEDIKILYRTKNLPSENFSINPSLILSPRQQKILQHIQTSNFITIQEVASFFQLAYSTIRADLEHLLEENIIERKKQGSRYLYFLSK
ncbi:MAG: DeoR family transcriptional regulator [Candidatus Brocadiae bacterium]|nr:DeoR family transcriptional regulator [Candidatus Brocadiia bacterium]